MALSILSENGANILHTPQHDLESLLYILFNIFTSTDGPGLLRVIPNAISIPLLEWFQDISSYQKLGRIKQGQLADYEHNIAAHFTDYWKPLRDYAGALFRATFPEGVIGHAPQPQITHKKMAAILTVAIRILGTRSDNDLVPRIMTMPSKTPSRPPAQKNGPIYPK